MVIKKCLECGAEFDARGSDVTCGPVCSKKRSDAYQKDYRMKNWMKWLWYKENAEKKPLGTSNITGKLCRTSDGKPDFEGEFLMIKAEMKHLGLIYKK